MTRPLLRFQLAGAWFAVDAAVLVEVQDAVPTTRLPFAPPHLLGLAHAGGRIVPVVTLAGFPALGLAPAEPAPLLLLVEGAGGGVLALAADRIGGRIEADPRPAALPGTPVVAAFDHDGHAHRLVDPTAVALAPGGVVAGTDDGDALVGHAAPAAPPPAAVRRFLLVEAGGHGVALDMDGLLMVVELGELRPLPHAPAVVRGIGAVMRRPVLVVDPLGAGRGCAHAVLLATPQGPVAVGVDAVRGVLRVAPDRLMAAEAASPGAEEAGVLLEHHGHRLAVRTGTGLLDDHREAIARLLPSPGSVAPDGGLTRARVWRRFLTVRVAGRLYALAFEHVRRIVPPAGRQRLPGGSGAFDGVAGVDGDILPVVDARRALGDPPRDGGGMVVLVEAGGGTVALVVDEVQRLRKVAADDIDPMADALTAAVVRIDGALVPVIRPDGLLAVPRTAAEGA